MCSIKKCFSRKHRLRHTIKRNERPYDKVSYQCFVGTVNAIKHHIFFSVQWGAWFLYSHKMRCTLHHYGYSKL